MIVIVPQDPTKAEPTVPSAPPSLSPPNAIPVTVVELPASFSKTSPVWSPLSLSLFVSVPSSPDDPSATVNVEPASIRPVSSVARGVLPVTVIVKVAVPLGFVFKDPLLCSVSFEVPSLKTYVNTSVAVAPFARAFAFELSVGSYV